MRRAFRLPVAVVVALACTAPALGQPACGTAAPSLDAIWQRVGGGWLAGDGAYSAWLPGNRDLWLFGDSVVARGEGIRIVRNAAVLKQRDGTLTTLPPTRDRGLAFARLPAAAGGHDWLWPGTPVWIDGGLWAFYSEIARTGPGGWDFRFVGSWLAHLDATTTRVGSMRRIGDGSGIAWGAAVVVTRRYLYVYGVHDHGGAVKHLHVARVWRAAGLTGGWRYWNRHQWGTRPDLNAHVVAGVSTQVSVLRLDRGYVLITHDPDLTSAVRAYRSKYLVGPWQPLNVLYHAVPRTATGITYNAQAHPELPGPGLVMSYSVMENSSNLVPANPDDYRPRFFRVPWSCLGGRRAPDPPRSARVLAVARPAAAQGGTIPSRPFGESRLAADARGAAVVVWVQAPDPTRPGAALYVARRPAGDAFGAPQRIAEAGSAVRTIGLAAAPSGRFALAWRSGDGGPGSRLVLARGTTSGGIGRGRILARTALPGAGWSGATEHPADPVVTVADDGSALVAWLAPSRCGYVVRARRVSAAGRLGRTLTLSRGCPRAATLRGAVDANGNGAIVWRAGRSCGYGKPCNYAIQAARLRRETPSPPVTVSHRRVAAVGLAVAAGGGRTVVAWRDAAKFTRELTLGRVLAAVAGRGGFGAPVALSLGDRIAGFPAAAAGRRGELVVAWQAQTGAGGAIEAASAEAGAGFLAPAATGGATNGSGYRSAPPVAFDIAGNATVGWVAVDGALRVATRAPRGDWLPAPAALGQAHAPALAGDGAGQVLGVWTNVSATGQLQSLTWVVLR